MTESGDSITSGVSNGQGRFSVAAPEGGSFVLIASAFGFKETAAGIFELGDDSEMDVEFRVAAAPMPIDGILVSLQRPALQHQLVKNGFVRRVTRGLGRFITPIDIERSSATDAADLFRGIPGVFLEFPGGGLNSARSPMGERFPRRPHGLYRRPERTLDLVRLLGDAPFAVLGLKGHPLDLRLRSPGRSGQDGDIQQVTFGYVAGHPRTPVRALRLEQGRADFQERTRTAESEAIRHLVANNVPREAGEPFRHLESLVTLERHSETLEQHQSDFEAVRAELRKEHNDPSL